MQLACRFLDRTRRRARRHRERRTLAPRGSRPVRAPTAPIQPPGLHDLRSRPGRPAPEAYNAAGLRRAVEFAGFRVIATSPFLDYWRGPGVQLSDLPLGTMLRY